MHFDLIQSISLAGTADVPNDDRAGNTPRLAWVIDGATDLGPPGLMGAQGGAAWLAGQAQAGFFAAADAPMDELFEALGTHLTTAFDATRTRAPEGRWELPLASVIAARIDGDSIELGWLGDCAALLRRGDDIIRLGPTNDSAAETARAASLAQHGLGKPKRSAPILDDLRRTRGRPEMRVLSVDPVHMAEVPVLTAPCAPGDELLLASDGFMALCDSYGVTDEAGLFAMVAEEGLANVTAKLREIEQDDADCTRFPRFKISDDATALWVRIGG
jgi:serine/threonine protein phosphatase PrpC